MPAATIFSINLNFPDRAGAPNGFYSTRIFVEWDPMTLLFKHQETARTRRIQSGINNVDDEVQL